MVNRAVINDEAEMVELLKRIDNAAPLEGQSKQAKLDDVTGEITRLEADLVGLRRMLIQHKRPDARIEADGGKTLAVSISSRLQQLTRLREYKEEIQSLPDDRTDESEEGTDEGTDEVDSEHQLNGN